MSEDNTENLLDQGSKDLLQKSSTKEQLKTEVTSIAKEEEKSGSKVNIPSAEELVARASSSLIVNKKRIHDLVTRKNAGKFVLSRKAMNRILLSILDLPAEDVIVNLKNDDEKLAFSLGQRMISDRFVVMQHHISQEMKKRMKTQSEEKSEDTNTPEGGTNE